MGKRMLTVTWGSTTADAASTIKLFLISDNCCVKCTKDAQFTEMRKPSKALMWVQILHGRPNT